MADFTLSIASGSPLGGQSITLTGAAFGAVAGSVTVDGRAATVTAWGASSVTIKTPARKTNSLLVVNDDPVQIVVTLSGGSTLSAPYLYNCTRLDLALRAVRAQIAQIHVDRGDYFTIGPSQIESFQAFQDDTGDQWPQGQVYAMPTNYAEDGQDQPYGFYTGTTRCAAQFTLLLDEADDWDTVLRWLCADLFRAIMLTRQTDSIANNYAVSTMYPGKIQGPQNGAMACATVEFDIELRTRNTNLNSVTAGD